MDSIDNLFKKYIDGNASIEEQTELADSLRTLSNDELSVYLKRHWDELDSTENVLDKRVSDEIYQQIIRPRDKKVTTTQFFRRRWFQVAASILLLVLGGASVYLVSHTENQAPEQLAYFSGPDLEPGGNKAILRLADGSTVDLDNSENGFIASQSDVEIVKTADGQLRYQGKGESSPVIQYNSVETPRGGQYHLVLPDSSVVLLNSASSIRFPVTFSKNERRVEISGEVYFEVKKDASKPFIVSNGKMNVRVFGTHFIVSAYPEDAQAKTTLLEGSVQVSLDESRLMLEPGQQAFIDADGNLEQNTDVNVAKESAWINGIFLFDHSSVQEIMTQISRWYDVDVEYQGTVTTRTFSGIVNRNSPVSSVLQLMEQAGLRFEIEEQKIIVREK